MRRASCRAPLARRAGHQVATEPMAAGRGGAGRTTGITKARGFGWRPVIGVAVAVELNKIDLRT